MNLEQITELFQPQLDKTKPECGDFLRGAFPWKKPKATSLITRK
jgi:hypothetical protein